MDLLVITEKPNQKKVIDKIIGSGGHYKGDKIEVVSMRGHIDEIPEFKDLKVFKEVMPDGKWYGNRHALATHRYFPHFPSSNDFYKRQIGRGDSKSDHADHKSRYSALTAALKRCEGVIIACDPDYEGAAIAHSVLRMQGAQEKVLTQLDMQSAKEKKVKAELDKALDGTYSDSHKVKGAIGLMRGDIDYAIGINATVKISSSLDDFFSFGTQQARLMWEILARHERINGFDSKKYYVVQVTTEDGHVFKNVNAEDDERFDKAFIESLYTKVKQTGSITLTDVSTKKKRRKPLPWFDGISLGQGASKELRIPLAKIMSRTGGLLQGMYEKGVLTYPGTEGTVMPLDQFDEQVSFAKSYAHLYPDVAFDFLLKKKELWAIETSDNHTPLTVDDHRDAIKKVDLNPNEEKILEIVIRRLLSVYAPDAIVGTVKADTIISGIPFSFSQNYDIENGWRDIYGLKRLAKTFMHQKGDTLRVKDITLEAMDTVPPKPYTLKATKESLASMMKRKGIGTDNTIPSLIDKLFANDYIQKNGNEEVSPTEKGIRFWSFFPRDRLLPLFDSFKSEIIPNMEKGKLDIAEGLIERDRLITTVWSEIMRCLDGMDEGQKSAFASRSKRAEPTTTDSHCPLCGGTIMLKETRYGEMFACENRTCKFRVYARNEFKNGSGYEIDRSTFAKAVAAIDTFIEVPLFSTKKEEKAQVIDWRILSSAKNGKYYSEFEFRTK